MTRGAARAPISPSPACANCGSPAPGDYCPHCGQETRQPAAIAEFFRGTFEHFLSLETKAGRTLVRLITSPGALTVDYLQGRRARYVRPLRLYLWISVLTIAIVESFDLQLALRFSETEGIYLFEPRGMEAAGEARIRGLRPMRFILDHFELQRFESMSAEEQGRLIQEQRHRNAQYFMLFLVPLLAALLMLCYRNRGRAYGEHLIFCLHTQSFLLLMLLGEAMLPGVLALAVTLWIIAYFFVALKRVYGGTWLDTVVRGFAALTLYSASFFVTGAALVYILLQFA